MTWDANPEIREALEAYDQAVEESGILDQIIDWRGMRISTGDALAILRDENLYGSSFVELRGDGISKRIPATNFLPSA